MLYLQRKLHRIAACVFILHRDFRLLGRAKGERTIFADGLRPRNTDFWGQIDIDVQAPDTAPVRGYQERAELLIDLDVGNRHQRQPSSRRAGRLHWLPDPLILGSIETTTE
ncbi:hypothetical protein HRbin36_01568 [bacterium HR36]|nr:hypothetical protein HRbin36_01568 [bacterium HR36]